MSEKLASIKKVGGGGGKGTIKIQLIGNYGYGTQSINVASYLKDGDTVDNFLVTCRGVNLDLHYVSPSGSSIGLDFNQSQSVSKSLSGTTLTVSNPRVVSEQVKTSSNFAKAYAQALISVYYVGIE